MAKKKEQTKDDAPTIGPVDAEPVDVKRKDTGMLVTGLAKAEIDMQITTAKANPRDVVKFKQDLRELATNDAEIAASCFYAVPRANKTIQGPSIRLAELALSCYGNILAQADISHEDGKYVYAVGVCRDLQHNTAVRRTVRRRITYKPKDGKPGGRYSDDMIATTGEAAAMIALRDAIFIIIPRAYINPVYEKCKQVAIGDARSMVQKRQNALDILGKMGVTEDRVLGMLGIRSAEQIGREQLIVLQGCVNALKNGEADIEAIFPPIPTEPADQLAAEPGGKQPGTRPKPAATGKTGRGGGKRTPSATSGKPAAKQGPAKGKPAKGKPAAGGGKKSNLFDD